MSLRRRRVLLLLPALALAVPAVSCGPDFPEAIFVKQFGPDAPYKAFVAGRLGVPQSTYRVRHLVIAYDVLSGRPLNPAEQAAAEQANTGLLNDGTLDGPAKAPDAGFDAWVKARTGFGPVDGAASPEKLSTTRSIPGSPYQDFPNCLDNAFATAARTLAARSASYGEHSPEVIEWVRGQDRVFANCGDLPSSFANGQYHPATPPPMSLPAVLQNAPPWLAQDRAYQIAAAHFYAVEYDQALAGFRTIAADRASPWSAVAEYLTARTMIRQATLAGAQAEMAQNSTPADQAAALSREVAALGKAQATLRSMRSEARMAPLQHGVDGLLNWLALRIDPQAQRLILAARLNGAADTDFGQDLIDLTYATSRVPHGVPGSSKGQTLSPKARPEEAMLAWVDTVAAEDGSAALANWRTTRSTTWLLAAMMTSAPGNPAAEELIHAAEAVPPTDPAWVALTYHRLRLMPPNASMRSALLAIGPMVEKLQGPSAKNLFAALKAASAPDLNAWLSTAGRIPAAEDYEGQENDLRPPEPPSAEGNSKPVDQPCGSPLSAEQTPLFTPPAAEALNTRMPLAVLASAAEGTVLPPNLRFALAQSTWTRAVLLGKPEIARRMTPVLAGCRAAWKPVLSAYDGAGSPGARQVAGLLALMRFASTEPNVRAGEQRPEGFATYSELRDNWWSQTVTPALNLSARNFSGAVTSGEQIAKQEAASATPADRANAALVPDPLRFLTAEDRTAAGTEIAALHAVPAASDYFAAAALAWWRAHPNDPANADLLGEAMRAARNAPRTDHTAANQHALFDALHSAYPNSAWAKKYNSWE